MPALGNQGCPANINADSGRSSTSRLAVRCLHWHQRLLRCSARHQRHLNLHRPHCNRRQQVVTPAAATAASTSSPNGSWEQQQPQQQQQQQQQLPAVGAEILVVCDRIGTEGVGICTAPPSKFVLLIKGALPGEQLIAKVTNVKKGYAEGIKLHTLVPHTNAANPTCPHFGTCGGCSLQNLEYNAQLNHKVDHVTQLFTRVAMLNPDLIAATRQNPIAAAVGQRYGYRNKIQLAFSSRVWQSGTSSDHSTSSSISYRLGPSGSGSRSNGAAGPTEQVAAEHNALHDGLQSQQSDRYDMLQLPGQQSDGVVVDGWGLGFYLPGSNSVVMPVQECSLVGPEANQLLAAVRQCCQQQGLNPYDPITGQGELRHLIIRTATAPTAATAGSSSSGGSEASGQQLMAVLVTTEACRSSQLQPVADRLMGMCGSIGLVSVVHSTEAAAAAAAGRTAAAGSSDAIMANGGNNGRRSKPSSKSGSRRSSNNTNHKTSAGSSGSSRQSRGARALTVSSSTVLCGVPYLTEQLCGLQFQIAPHSFFQTNTRQAELLYGQVAAAVQGYYQAAAAAAQGAAAAGAAGHSGVVLDLYTGTGTIALSLANSGFCKEVIGFDISQSSIQDAQANAQRNGIQNARFVCGDLNQLARGGLLGPGVTPDVVVVDPARAGLGKSVVEYVLSCGAKRLVYVSCNAATQARDLQLLCGEGVGGRFEVKSWVAVDMYPQTGVEHVETVVIMDRL